MSSQLMKFVAQQIPPPLIIHNLLPSINLICILIALKCLSPFQSLACCSAQPANHNNGSRAGGWLW
jgi:hypothetical protein